MKEFTRGYQYASNYYDVEKDKQKAIDHLFVVSDCDDFTNFDRGIIEFLNYNNLRSTYEPYFGELT